MTLGTSRLDLTVLGENGGPQFISYGERHREREAAVLVL